MKPNKAPKEPKQPKPRSDKYEPKLAINSTFENAIKSLVQKPKKDIKK